MHLLFDGKSVQVQQQKSSKTRLNTLLGAIRSAGAALHDPWKVSNSAGRLKRRQLAGIDVLVVLTRDPVPKRAYTAKEIDAIFDYVHGGGNLLLMTSHCPNMVNDAPLAARFGITLHPTLVSNPLVDKVAANAMVMSGRCLNRSLAKGLLYQVDALIAHDSCEIAGPPSAVSIAKYPQTAVVTPGGHPPKYKDFSIAVRSGAGQVIVVGNSGFLCDYGDITPACGLAPLGSNLLFFLNCIRFLTGQPTPRYSGCCPGEQL